MGIAGSSIDPDFIEEYLGMRVESVDEVEDETGDEDDDGAISFKKFFKKK